MEFYSTPDQVPSELLRNSDASPSSLRPRAADVTTGLSCFDTLERMLTHFVEIGRPLRTQKDTYVVLGTGDFGDQLIVVADAQIEGHYFIRTANPADMEAWIAENASERPLTQALIDSIIKDSEGKKRRKIP